VSKEVAAVAGANDTAPPPESSPPPVLSGKLAASRAANRAAFMSSVAAAESEAPDRPLPASLANPPDEAAATDTKPAAPSPVEDDADTDVEPAKAPEKPAEDKPDPEIQKRLDVIQKAEKRSKDALEEHRAKLEAEHNRKVAEFERRHAEMTPKLDAYEKAMARVHVDPAGLLESLGFDMQAHGAYLSKLAWGKSKEGSQDPRYRAEAERAMRERELGSESQQALKELREFKAQIEAEKKAEATKREAEAYLNRTLAAVGDATPLAKRLLTRNEGRAVQRLADAAARLYDKTGEHPDPDDIVKELESELAELALTDDAPPKTKTLPADETKTAPTLSSDLGTPTQPRTKRLSKEERRRDIVAALERGGRAQ
jgi:hypothetical protein